MQRVILFRHAHADSARGQQSDVERPLSSIGRAEAESAAAWLVEHGYRPDRVACSPSVRTRQTLDCIGAAVDGADIAYDERIYEATPGTLIDVAEAHDGGGCLMLVGHNPGLEQLAALLASGQTGDYRGMPPAGIAVIDMPDATAPLEPGAGRLVAFWAP